MIDLYSWATPNGQKIHIMLEETGLPYNIHAIDITKGEQFSDEFLTITPNHKIPAIIDSDGLNDQKTTLFESGAILIYLANKANQFIPAFATPQYYQCVQWLMFQMGGIGPMFGQAHHFNVYADEKIPYAIDRYTKESNRLFSVMDKQLSLHTYLAGDEYTIADIATYPWVRYPERKGVSLQEYPNVSRWYNSIEKREKVQKGISILEQDRHSNNLTEEQKNAMFGDMQFKKR